MANREWRIANFAVSPPFAIRHSPLASLEGTRTMNQKNLLEVDWSKIPAPSDDGAAAHLVGKKIPEVSLVATDDSTVTLSALPGRLVVFAYPRTGEPGKISLVDDWDMIPGARGCTPQ